jgi:putative endonuclease
MKKLNTNQLGNIGSFGEDIAVEYLVSQGYDIIERNAVCGGNEIDIIAMDMRYIVFVEVKTRTKYYGKSIYGRAAKAVDKNKQSHIISAAKAYLKENYHRRMPRFDVIEVYVEHTDNSLKVVNVNHLPRAFVSGR